MLQHIIIGILLGFLGCQVKQKVITLGQAIFIYSISNNLFYVINDFWSLYFFTKNSDGTWRRIKRILLRECENNDVNNDIEKINSIVF
ncbi:hypothetical protein ATZ36_01400 [Candidatus Endomicrobiellum trichonymphae]|jgi:ABC-type bacteriocin/lantibiotic exporter with double-glycine peptidase domain|uniref:Uncharacterized protein n=1 Tax=Endomicrobium trichonymphae TaxID=1408204 RepID=A0A1E5II27_ENDTX|nr:hypothetical protein ATZ36_01400 [Candidatus Endomicrobium trichonymphae]